jgi:hypothetical protein
MRRREIRSTSVPKPKKMKPIPTFETEDQEREFWATHDSTDYVDWKRAKAASSRLKPSTQAPEASSDLTEVSREPRRLAALDRIRGLLDRPSATIGERLPSRDELHER